LAGEVRQSAQATAQETEAVMYIGGGLIALILIIILLLLIF
jgi:hypothetical protein